MLILQKNIAIFQLMQSILSICVVNVKRTSLLCFNCSI